MSTRVQWRPAAAGLHVGALVFERQADPATEPLSLSDAKEHLRVDSSDEDSYIGGLIGAARSHIEQETSRALITQTWTRWVDCFPGFREQILLPRPPLQDVTEIEIVDEDGGTQVVDDGVYDVDTHATPGRVSPAPGQSWPTTADRPNAVAITYTAGYGDSAEDVPGDLVHALKLVVSQLYEHREPVVVGTVSARLPKSVDWLLDPYRVWWS